MPIPNITPHHLLDYMAWQAEEGEQDAEPNVLHLHLFFKFIALFLGTLNTIIGFSFMIFSYYADGCKFLSVLWLHGLILILLAERFISIFCDIRNHLNVFMYNHKIAQLKEHAIICLFFSFPFFGLSSFAILFETCVMEPANPVANITLVLLVEDLIITIVFTCLLVISNHKPEN